MEINWIRPVLILGALVLLILLNVLEFKGKRKRDAADKVAITASSDPAHPIIDATQREQQHGSA